MRFLVTLTRFALLAFVGFAISQLGTARVGASTPVALADLNGAWHDGPYKIHISTGKGMLSFTWLRSSGTGTCCPVRYDGAGSCTVKGDDATCRWHEYFNNIANDRTGAIVRRNGHGTMALSKNLISVRFIEDAGTWTDAGGHPCPDRTLNHCPWTPSFIIGDVYNAYWER